MQNIKFLIFCLFYSRVYCDLAESFNCSHLTLVEPHPSSCCDYPISTISNTTIKTCYMECESIKRSSAYKSRTEQDIARCCVMNCLYREEEILLDSKMNKENLRKSFKMAAMPNLSSEWNGIIQDAVDACVQLFPQSRQRYDNECLPEYFLNIVICIYNEMFLNCSGFDKKRQECKNLITIVNKCKEKGDLSNKDWDEFYF